MEKETGTEIDGTTELAQVNNHMAVALYKLFAKNEGNLFFSPFSISCTMAMLFQGTRGQAAAELKTALGYEAYGIKDEDILSSFKCFLKSAESDEGYVFNSANSIVVQKDFTIKETYLKMAQDVFQALVIEVDFLREASKAVSQINEWVSKKTNQMIPRLLEDLDSETVVALLNAVYFKGDWERIFDEGQTCTKPFYNMGLDNIKTDVPTMHLTTLFEFSDTESFSALEMPYAGNNVVMLLLLPHEKKGLQDLERQLGPAFVQEVRKNMMQCLVDVALPRFRLEYQQSLKDSFQAMGVKEIFVKGADLGRMSDFRELEVSQIIHKAVVEVNEEGTVASAASEVCCRYLCAIEEVTFFADHPFLFVILDTRNDLILFMGKVEDLR